MSSDRRAPTQTDSPESLGELLQEFVNRVAHVGGRTLAVLADASVTLQQVLVLRRLQQLGESTASELAERMRMSLPAMSQMIDRLFEVKLLTRVEAASDRRRKTITLTATGSRLLRRISQARSSDYSEGMAPLSPRVRVELARILNKVLEELPLESEVTSIR